MLEMRRRVHEVLSEFPDVVSDYIDVAENGSGKPRSPVLESWVMVVRWIDLDPDLEEDPEGGAGWHTMLHSGCNHPTRYGLAHGLVDMLRNE